MKKQLVIISTILWFCVTIKVFAQSPTLTATNSNPLIGEFFTGQGINYTAPGSGGASQVWNFSSLASIGTQSFSVINPVTTANAASFPTSNVTTYNPATSSYNYYTTSAASLLANGYFVSPNNLVPYSTPQKVMDYPFSMGANFVAPYQGTYTSGSNTIIRKGSINVIADGYGSLILPYGTLNNVLRTLVTDDYADTTSLNVPFSKFTIITYNWYLPGVHCQVMSLTSVYMNGGPTPVAQFGNYLDQTSTTLGVAKNYLSNPNFTIYPNPSKENIIIKSNQKIENVKCFNTLGNVVEVNHESNLIDISSVLNGLYFLHITTEDQKTVTAKFIKE